MFIFEVTEPSPLQDSFSVRQKGGLPVTVTVVVERERLGERESFIRNYP